MYHILWKSLHIAGLPGEYSQVFPRSGLKFRHTSNPLSCRGWWSQIWHCTHILFTRQCCKGATHYQHMIPVHDMIPLQARLWTVYTHFALPLNDTFCSIPSIFYPFWILWLCGCQHTQSVIFQTTNFDVQERLIPLGLSKYQNLYLIGMWWLPPKCHNCHAQCQPILWRKVFIIRIP
jgi:hypothetical protein